MELVITEIEGRGDMAFVSGYSTGIDDSGKVVRRGKYLDIRKRQPDGSWRYIIDNPYGAPLGPVDAAT